MKIRDQVEEAIIADEEKLNRQKTFIKHKKRVQPNPIAKDLLQSTGFYRQRVVQSVKKKEKNRQSLAQIIQGETDSDD